MKIAIVSSEVYPFAKTGGLADVCGALGKYLKKGGHDVRLITPFYSATDVTIGEFHAVDYLRNLEIWFGDRLISFSVHTAKLPGSKTDVYFISCPELYNRWTIYTNDPDEWLRFALLNRAAIEICQRMGWSPDIFHCNDWQTALIPLYLKTTYSWDSLFTHSKTLLTIHNIGYQGIFGSDILGILGFSGYPHWLDDYDMKAGITNYMKLGIIHAHKLSTVSKTYAEEIQTAVYGEGLQDMLAYRKNNLTGIVNGVDYETWNPAKDPHIPFHFSLQDVSGKKKNKEALCEHVGLEFTPDVPIVGLISRLVAQKGMDLIVDRMEHFIANYDMQFIVLGSGDQLYEEYFEYLLSKYSHKMALFRGYNNHLAHLIEAGADIFLMPSRYEPCGLNQIYSLHYGTIPVVRKTGGLADTVELYDWESQTGTGFVFEDYTPDAFAWALDYALTTYKNKRAWKILVKNAMSQNFSWETQIKEYVKLYKSLFD